MVDLIRRSPFADSEISTARENTKAALANQPGNVRKVVYEEYPDLVPW